MPVKDKVLAEALAAALADEIESALTELEAATAQFVKNARRFLRSCRHTPNTPKKKATLPPWLWNHGNRPPGRS